MNEGIKVTAKNSNYAKLLLKAYAGNASELTAINTYIFQAIYLKESYPEISQVLEDIAINEMKHFFYLGQTINLLGCIPITGSVENDNVFRLWNASSVMFYTSLKDILEMDMKDEYDAIEAYKKLIYLIDDVYIKNLLKSIISQEEEHIKLLNDIYNKYVIK